MPGRGLPGRGLPGRGLPGRGLPGRGLLGRGLLGQSFSQPTHQVLLLYIIIGWSLRDLISSDDNYTLYSLVF